MNFISIEGNIGVGKTSLVHVLSKKFRGTAVLERYVENPFLESFYKDPSFAIDVENFFLKDRVRHIQEIADKRQPWVADYDLYKCLVFAKTNLPAFVYQKFEEHFHESIEHLPKPQLTVLLSTQIETLLENISRRGREMEQNIDPEYLRRLNNEYNNTFDLVTDRPILKIDVTELNYVESQNDLDHVLDLIDKKLNVITTD